MVSENETVAEIIQEIRNEWACVYFSEDSRRQDGEYCDNDFVVIESRSVADRIEAAYKREVAVKDATITELHNCLKETTNHICANCGKDYEGKCNNCIVKNKWRKALGGANNEGK